MNTKFDEKIGGRFVIAAEGLLRQPAAPEFANDSQSVAFIAGPPIEADYLAYLAQCTAQSCTDLVYLEFERRDETSGPGRLIVLAERGGAIYKWTDCVLWAPLGAGPLLIMPRGLNVCFAYDGLALISRRERPTRTIAAGVARARSRLSLAARKVTEEQVSELARRSQSLAA